MHGVENGKRMELVTRKDKIPNLIRRYSEKMGYVKSLFVLVSLFDAMGTLEMSQTNTVL